MVEPHAGMACPEFARMHYDLALSRCPCCGAPLRRPERRPNLARADWPPRGYGTFNGLFTSTRPKTNEEFEAQALIERCWCWLPPSEAAPMPPRASQAQAFKSPQLRRLRHCIEPGAR